MKKLKLKEMHLLTGGVTQHASESVTGFLCASTVGLLLTPGSQPLAAATGIGCALGMWTNW